MAGHIRFPLPFPNGTIEIMHTLDGANLYWHGGPILAMTGNLLHLLDSRVATVNDRYLILGNWRCERLATLWGYDDLYLFINWDWTGEMSDTITFGGAS